MVTEEEVKAIRVPTLAVLGAQDFVKSNVDDLKGLPGLKTVVIDKNDHLSTFFSPLFLETIQSFLKQQRVRPD